MLDGPLDRREDGDSIPAMCLHVVSEPHYSARRPRAGERREEAHGFGEAVVHRPSSG
jgi:hypothetical protein